jgi:hypothetical protein
VKIGVTRTAKILITGILLIDTQLLQAVNQYQSGVELPTTLLVLRLEAVENLGNS